MDYQNPSHLEAAAYAYPPPPPLPPSYHPGIPEPHFNFYPNPCPNPNNPPSFNFHHQHPPPPPSSSFHGVASAPPPLPPEPHYPVGGYASQATVHGGHYGAGGGGYFYDPHVAPTSRFEDSSRNPVYFPNSSGNAMPPSMPEQLAPITYNHDLGTTRKTQHQVKSSSKKTSKKTKTPLSVCCDVCKIVCDTEEVLKKHRVGKKHKQNLEKLKAMVAGQACSNSGARVNPQSKKKKASEKADDLETKKKRVLEGGAAQEAVRTCSICKVVCNSETVFQYHLGGQKHAAMVKKQGSGIATQAAVGS